MKRLLLATVLIAAPMLAHAADAPKIDPAKLSNHIKILSSDDFEGRGPGTAGETKAVGYIVDQMVAIGLTPAGDVQKSGSRSWTQNVPLAKFEIAGPVTAHAMVGGQHVMLNQGEQIAIRAAMTNVDAVSIKDAPIVFAGYGVNAPERNWDDFKGLDVKGKILVVLINDPDFETGEGDFGGKAMTYYGRWTYKFEEAARLGAAGVLIVHETAPASYGWNTVKNSNTNTMFDIVRKDPEKTHPKLEAWIQRDVAVDLFKKAGLDFDALKTQAQTRDFKPVELKGATFSADFKVKHETIVSKNIAGRIVGSKYPDETIIYSGHWDHLGIGAPDAKGDKIYNGAVDNADGIAGILELARAFKSQPAPQRSILFLAVTAEEKGLLGSEYYSDNPLFPVATTVADINIDALSAAGPAKDVTTSGDGKVDLQDMLAAKAKAHGRYFTPDPTPQAGHFYRSDHFPFAKRGVPAISIGSGNDLIKGGKEAGEKAEADYNEKRYHQPADEWSADWDLSGQAMDLGLVYEIGADLANSRVWPQWQAGSEFKALRDQTASKRK
ncbi:M28 family metallopeptidase [Caulobacter sp. RHG1]|uniref:M28 family metallopeptidase n=1 Tax=Caulobacter sp. (strain RHG1) TaxID=2545762 RepID=UPI0015523A6C|nr:M28 family metallopeptidase [Caulobacter sp. RHG1]NQE61002.1 Peptidase, M20/M25/M40 family [Caulobacter sp. RHG1]